jgi:AcrR family transcriptional regulator
MTKQTSLKRKYDSSRRQALAEATKIQIAEAARGLFFKRGYVGTTMEEIANEAGVSKESVYSIFGNKQGVLAFLLDASVGGKEFPLPLIEQSAAQAIMQERDPRRQIDRIAQACGEILSRAAPVYAIMRTAANVEPEIQKRVRQLHRERLENMTSFYRQVAANGPLRKGMDEKRAGEMVWALTSPELFNLLVIESGWSREKYSQWLADILTRVLLS